MLLLCFFAILAVAMGQSARARYQTQNGVDYIDLANPALSNIANLQYNAHSPSGNGAGALWLTADKSNPNIWISRINSSVKEPNDWWFELASPFKPKTLAPLIAFDTVGDNIFGVSLPSAVDNSSSYDTAIQAVSYSGENGLPGQPPFNYPGYSFYSIVLSQTKVPGENHFYGYLTGWADDQALGRSGFFIARISTTPGVNPTFQFDVEKDIRANISNPTQACYDLFSTEKKPSMWLDSKYLYIAVTGRCAFIIKVTLPGNMAAFKDALVQVSDPAPGDDEYLSSAVRDPSSNLVFLAVQNYDRKVLTKIMTFNLETFKTPITPPFFLNTQGQARALLAFGIDGIEKNLYAFASGSAEAFRFTTDASGVLTIAGMATLPQNFRTIGSVVVVNSYVYFSTYSNNAVIARMHKTGSFCGQYCGVIGFCELGSCSCQVPYKKVYNTNGTLTCENPKEYEYVNKEVANQKAVVGFGVLFAFALVAAMAGWFLWWRGRAASYQTLA